MRPILLLLPLVVACGGGSPEPKNAEAPKTSTTGASASPIDVAVPARAPIKQLKRTQVKTAIGQGLGVLLQNVQLDDYPAMKDGRFYGFKLKALSPDWAVDLRSGDVILRVNGQSIEHPEEADAALRSLEKAPALKVDYEREGKPRTLEIPIVD